MKNGLSSWIWGPCVSTEVIRLLEGGDAYPGHVSAYIAPRGALPRDGGVYVRGRFEPQDDAELVVRDLEWTMSGSRGNVGKDG